MPVNCSISAENKNDVSIARARHADAPLDPIVLLKWFEILGRTSQSENRRCPHRGDESSRISRSEERYVGRDLSGDSRLRLSAERSFAALALGAVSRRFQCDRVSA